jgi:hypothetical protein
MDLTPGQFLKKIILEGCKEEDLNLIKNVVPVSALQDSSHPSYSRFMYLIKRGHGVESAWRHLNLDLSCGYTVCRECGSFYFFGIGYKKHFSDGCLHCQGKKYHQVSWQGELNEWISPLFDDCVWGLVGKLEPLRYKNLILQLKKKQRELKNPLRTGDIVAVNLQRFARIGTHIPKKDYYIGRVIHVFEEGKVIPKEEVIKYFGENILHPEHARLYKALTTTPTKSNRYVIDEFGGSDAKKNYVVAPQELIGNDIFKLSFESMSLGVIKFEDN